VQLGPKPQSLALQHASASRELRECTHLGVAPNRVSCLEDGQARVRCLRNDERGEDHLSVGSLDLSIIDERGSLGASVRPSHGSETSKFILYC
jgi:hypothetical protein